MLTEVRQVGAENFGYIIGAIFLAGATIHSWVSLGFYDTFQVAVLLGMGTGLILLASIKSEVSDFTSEPESE